MKGIEFSRNQLQVIIFSSYLFLLIFKSFNSELIYQQNNPPFFYPALNIPYWIFLLSGFKDQIFENTFLKISIDFLLFFTCTMSIFKTKTTLYPILFSFLIWLYQFLYFSILTYQPFAIGLLFPCLPFIFKEEFKFYVSFNFGKYFLCGLYFLAGILKIFNGGIFNKMQMSDSIRMSSLDFMLYHPNSLKTEIMSLFISNISIGYLLYFCAMLLELTFVIGFLNKKYNLFLAFLFLLFHITNYIILDLPFINHLIIITFLLPIKTVGNKSTV